MIETFLLNRVGFLNFQLRLFNIVRDDFLRFLNFLANSHRCLSDLLSGLCIDFITASLSEQLEFINCCQFGRIHCTTDNLTT